jgi:hypothetical protein
MSVGTGHFFGIGLGNSSWTANAFSARRSVFVRVPDSECSVSSSSHFSRSFDPFSETIDRMGTDPLGRPFGCCLAIVATIPSRSIPCPRSECSDKYPRIPSYTLVRLACLYLTRESPKYPVDAGSIFRYHNTRGKLSCGSVSLSSENNDGPESLQEMWMR